MPAKNPPRIKLDDFVGAVRSDPSACDPLLFTSGYVGRSPTEGNIRIYSDPSLSRWVEAAEEDVVHSMPIADSPLGGSHLWLKGAARLSPGVAGGPTGEPVPGIPGGPIPVPRTIFEPCFDTRFPQCIEQQAPVTLQLICPTQPPMCIPQEAPVTRQLVCPTQPPMCLQQQLPHHPFGSLACAGMAARPEPAFTDPAICQRETGHIPCANFPAAAARGWFTVHFCAAAQQAQPMIGTQWQSCACPSPSAGPWNC